MALEKLLRDHPALQEISTKIKCKYSGHEMPQNVDVVKNYISGKRYKTLLKQNEYSYESVQPYIVQSQRRSHQLYCRLTRRYINKIPDHVERHRNGKKFTRALQKYKQGECTLWEEMPQRKAKKTRGGNVRQNGSKIAMGGDGEEDLVDGAGDDDFMPMPTYDNDCDMEEEEDGDDGSGESSDSGGDRAGDFGGKDNKEDDDVDDRDTDDEENIDDGDDSDKMDKDDHQVSSGSKSSTEEVSSTLLRKRKTTQSSAGALQKQELASLSSQACKQKTKKKNKVEALYSSSMVKRSKVQQKKKSLQHNSSSKMSSMMF